MAQQLPQNREFDPPVIPDRLYFKIGDVARICDVKTYVLRFWETQFPQLKPNKSGTGQRLYRRRDVELALKIKHLVHVEGYTLAGARQVLEQGHFRQDPQPDLQPDPQASLPLSAVGSGQTLDSVASALAQTRTELREIASLLASSDPKPPRRRPRLALVRSSSDSLFPLFDATPEKLK
jgi:DNA-binding transcriptional MerR regulator